MARIEQPDGSEVFTPDEPETVPERKFSAFGSIRARKKRRKDGLTERQRLEQGIGKILRTGYDYISGEGDDADRALKMLGLKDDDAPEPRVIDPDFD